MRMEEMKCTMGRFDIPIVQMQPDFEVNLLDSNIIIFGSAMSGKTTFLKTLLNILHKQFREDQEQIFILDFSSALFSYRDLPLVSAYFDNSNEEYVKRVFKIMDGILKENIQKLNGQNYSECQSQPNHTTFMIDNVNAFLDEPRYSAYHEKLAKLCRDGLSKGITLVLTASDNKGLGNYLGAFKQKVAFSLPQEQYQEIFNEKVGVIGNNPGHGYANVTVKIPDVPGSFHYNLPYEFQCCTPFRDDNDSEKTSDLQTMDEFYAKLKQVFGNGTEYTKTAKKYRIFPSDLTRTEYAKLLDQTESKETVIPDGISVGLDYVDFLPVRVDPMRSHTIGIYGKKEFGKTNLLRILLKEAADRYDDLRVVLVDDGRKQLSEENLGLRRHVKEVVAFRDYAEETWVAPDHSTRTMKRSPLQQFYVYLNANYIGWEKFALKGCYPVSKDAMKERQEVPQLPDCTEQPQPTTIFVLQTKQMYLKSNENKYFLEHALPQLLSQAEEKRVAFIFSDIQKFNETDYQQYLNDPLSVVFLLDNIAEFASERGQRSVFGSMDAKTLKEDYARCELGDGYYYDVEADNLKKVKFIKEDAV